MRDSARPLYLQGSEIDYDRIAEVVRSVLIDLIGKNATSIRLRELDGQEQQTASPDQQVFDRNEAAAFLRLKVSTLDKTAARGLIHPNRATRKPLYSREELLRFLRENTAKLD